MEVKDWISIASAFIIAIGWFITGYLNRVKDVAQKRLEYRLKALEAFLPVWFAIIKNEEALTQPEILIQFQDAREKFHLYGLEDENELIEQLALAIRNKDILETNAKLKKLVLLVRSRIRDELQINS